MKNFFRNEAVWMFVFSLGIPALGLLVGLLAPRALHRIGHPLLNPSSPAAMRQQVP
jgi:hypothetical protein